MRNENTKDGSLSIKYGSDSFLLSFIISVHNSTDNFCLVQCLDENLMI
jgi:hypothetical protein